MYIPRKLARSTGITALILGGVVALGWVGDSLVAMRAESHISAEVGAAANLARNPSVFLGGNPYVQALITEEIPLLNVEALDVDVEGLGIVNAYTTLSAITVNSHQVFSGDLNGAQAKLLERRLRLDGVALGNQLGITDLDIAHPYDISPAGGLASEARLSGTPPGMDEKVSAVVTLRLVGPMFYMQVRELIDVPSELAAETTKAFSYELDTRTLPLVDQADVVYVQGGSIYFGAEQRNVTVRVRALSPLAVDSEEEAEAEEESKRL